MADESGLSPYVFACEGGLVLDQPTFKMSPGMALELENFEPDVRGGYRRINGHIKWNSNIVPQTSSATEKVLMSAFFGITSWCIVSFTREKKQKVVTSCVLSSQVLSIRLLQ